MVGLWLVERIWMFIATTYTVSFHKVIDLGVCSIAPEKA